MHYLIKDTEFIKILNVLQEIKGLHTKNIDRLRNFFEAVYFILRSGCQWRLLPSEYGHYRTAHKRFKEWSQRNIWELLFEKVKEDPDMEYVMIDSTIVRAHACAAGYGKDSQNKEALGRSKGGFTTKIHALVDALGNPLKFILTAGQRNDITQAEFLTKDITDTFVIADKGYDADSFIRFIENNRCISIIPPRLNRKKPRNYDEHLYKERNGIECFFGKIKHYRRVFSRFDKSAKSFLSFCYFVAALIWLK